MGNDEGETGGGRYPPQRSSPQTFQPWLLLSGGLPSRPAIEPCLRPPKHQSVFLSCVDGSCAKHLTVESYTVVMLLTFILIIISIPSPSLFHSRLKTFLFCKSFPPQPFLFFSRTDYMDSPDCLLLLLSISVFYFLVFLLYTF